MASVTITLPDTNSHNLKTLLVAAKTLPAYEFRELLVLADTTNGANNIAVGDSDVTDAVYGYLLTAGASRLYRPPSPGQKVYTSNIYVKASAGTPVLHIEGTY